MKIFTCVVVLFGAVFSDNFTRGPDVLTNYAKVSVNDRNSTSIGKLSVSTEPLNSTSEEENDDYDDFDDSTAATERPRSAILDGSSMMKAVGGFISLLTLMNQFSGKRGPRENARTADTDPLAESINDLAVEQGRYNPTTATKKFKLAQGGYPPLQKNPVYLPPAGSPADSYSSNGGKSSYDADSDQYMVKNPEMNTFTAADAPKPPLKDYMVQNESPVDIQQSYSYELPAETGHEDMHDHELTEKPLGPVYYPWMNDKKPSDGQKAPKYTQDDDGYYPYPLKKNKPQPAPYMPPKRVKPATDHDIPPWGQSPHKMQAEGDIPPWAQHPPKRAKPMDEEEPEIPWAHGKPGKEHIYPYPPYPDHHDDSYDHGLLYPGDDDHHSDHHEDHEDHDDHHDMQDEDRENKHPYTYYHLGRKLWYVPLLFSLYFIVYIGALLLKSIARHKVQFPEKLWEVHDHHHHDRQGRTLESVTESVLTGLEKAENKYM